eukprot:4861853-Prorocentrum_lima.AAC.1
MTHKKKKTTITDDKNKEMQTTQTERQLIHRTEERDYKHPRCSELLQLTTNNTEMTTKTATNT